MTSVVRMADPRREYVGQVEIPSAARVSPDREREPDSDLPIHYPDPSTRSRSRSPRRGRIPEERYPHRLQFKKGIVP